MDYQMAYAIFWGLFGLGFVLVSVIKAWKQAKNEKLTRSQRIKDFVGHGLCAFLGAVVLVTSIINIWMSLPRAQVKHDDKVEPFKLSPVENEYMQSLTEYRAKQKAMEAVGRKAEEGNAPPPNLSH